jgi:putative oxidoreductase
LSNRIAKNTATTESQRAAYFLMSGRHTPKRGIGASRHWGLPAAKTAGIVVMMAKFLSRYPDGAAGIALVLLRLACASIAVLIIAPLPFPRFSPNASIVVSAAFALALALGLGTRIVAFVSAAAAIATAFMTGSDIALTMIACACGCAALGLLGPGAYSIDANLFGRRVVRLEPRGPDRASDA